MLLMTAMLYAVVRVSSCVKINSDVSAPSMSSPHNARRGEEGPVVQDIFQIFCLRYIPNIFAVVTSNGRHV